ncbi:MAG: LysR family transcriptional regulator [Rhodobacteraceae bacterium]|nr:LysR family transcriptional regulator [Paracoccaceae bacterium]
MEFQQLKHFLAAVEHGNIGRAAETLHISQSGLSRSIKNLETTVGVSLLKRTARGVEPTVHGVQLIPRARAILNQANRAREDLETARATRGGHVRIGVTVNFAHYLMPDLIFEISKSNPDIQWTVLTGTFGQAIEKIQSAEVDLFFGLLVPLSEETELTIDTLFESRSGIYGRIDHPLARKKKVEVQDLAGERWATFDSKGLKRELEGYFERNGLPAPAFVVTTNSYALLKQSVMQLNLLAIIPRSLADPDVGAKKLALLASQTPGDHVRAGLVYREESLAIPAVAEVIATLKEKARIFAKPV